jgi:SAM-dependent methyltransferase
MNDQRAIWEAAYAIAAPVTAPRPANDFAREVEALLPRGARVLELGCGPGSDAAFFAVQGHDVLAIDHAEGAIDQARALHPETERLRFAVHAIAQPFDLPDAGLDLVYARLSLHYFLDAQTRAVFRELRRLLREGGLLAFMCKTVDDPLYGRGTLIEPGVYESDHLRHFFSEAYTRDLLQDGFVVESLVSKRDDLYGNPSAFIEVVARRLS